MVEVVELHPPLNRFVAKTKQAVSIVAPVVQHYCATTDDESNGGMACALLQLSAQIASGNKLGPVAREEFAELAGKYWDLAQRAPR